MNQLFHKKILLCVVAQSNKKCAHCSSFWSVDMLLSPPFSPRSASVFPFTSVGSHFRFLPFIPPGSVAAKPRGLSGAACAPGGGRAHSGCAGHAAAAGRGDHQQPTPRRPGLQHPADGPSGPPAAPGVRQHLPAGAQCAVLGPAVSPEGEAEAQGAGQLSLC